MHTKNSKTYFLPMIALVIIVMAISAAAQARDPLKQYNVVWESPSDSESGSMPLGNGDIGLNAWVEKNGDLLFYISKNDSASENDRLLKLGRIRIKMNPNPFFKSKLFKTS